MTNPSGRGQSYFLVQDWGINPRNHFGPGFGLGQLLVVYEGSFRQQQASPTLANTPQLLPKKISYSPPKTAFSGLL